MGKTTENNNVWEMCKDQNESSSINKGDSRISSSSGVCLKKGPWTAAEDEILVDYVIKHGEGNWTDVQKNTGLLRSGKSCRLRWVNQLRPELKKGAFTPEEVRLIIDLHAKIGNKWALMTEYLPGRTDNEIKNFWNSRIKRCKRAGLPLYPPELCSQGLPGSSQAHETGMSSSGDKCHHATVQYINSDNPGAMHSGLKVNEQDLPYGSQFHNMFMINDMMGSTGCTQYFNLHPQNNHYKKLRESPEGVPGSLFFRGDGFSSPADLTKSYDKASCILNLSPMHHPPASEIKLKPTDLELHSIQNLEMLSGFEDKCYLSCLPLESFDAFHDSSSPIEDILSETPSESGLLESFFPNFHTSNTAIDLSSVANSTSSTATPCHMEGTSGLNLSKMEQKYLINPISSLDPSNLATFPDCNLATSSSRGLNIEQSAVYTFPGYNESIEEAPADADVDGLSNWLNLSSPERVS